MEAKKFGLIGHPVGHSLSAVMHNRVFKELNLPHTYEAFDVLPENLENFIATTSLDGLNVTIPHKVAVMRFLDELDQSAKDIHAVNTIHFNDIKMGHNTDGIGFTKSLEEEGIKIKGKNVLVVGAGGASRAILSSLVQNEANVTLTNRTREKAEILIFEMGEQELVKILDYTPEKLKEVLQETDIIVNTTSLGMHPNVDTSPIPKEFLKPNHVIFDAVYNPIETKLIKDAKSIGCKTISGVSMLVHQGAQSLRIWLGIEPPIQIMKDAVMEKLISQ